MVWPPPLGGLHYNRVYAPMPPASPVPPPNRAGAQYIIVRPRPSAGERRVVVSPVRPSPSAGGRRVIVSPIVIRRAAYSRMGHNVYPLESSNTGESH